MSKPPRKRGGLLTADILKPMLIIGNWKAYVENPESAKTLMASAKRVALKTRHKLVVAPPAPYLGMLGGNARSKVALAVQDVSEAVVGAATGEVPAVIAKRAGATYAIIGHSECRARGESDQVVAEKVVKAISAGLTPVVCVGEKERDANAQYLAVLRAQLDAVFAKLTPKDRKKIVVAYEPVWAIGKSASDAASPREVAEMMLYIRKVLTQYDAGKTVILYGGSVEPANARALAKEGGVGGFLIGHASADPKMFAAIVQAA